jgi:hypothetical protein
MSVQLEFSDLYLPRSQDYRLEPLHLGYKQTVLEHILPPPSYPLGIIEETILNVSVEL